MTSGEHRSAQPCLGAHRWRTQSSPGVGQQAAYAEQHRALCRGRHLRGGESRCGVRAMSGKLGHHVAGRQTHRPPPPRLRRRHPCSVFTTGVPTLRLRRRAAAQQLAGLLPWANHTRPGATAASCSQPRGGAVPQPRALACPPASLPRRGCPPGPFMCLPAQRSVQGAARPHRLRLPTLHAGCAGQRHKRRARLEVMTWQPKRQHEAPPPRRFKMAAVTQTLAFAPLSATRVSRRSASAFVGGASSCFPTTRPGRPPAGVWPAPARHMRPAAAGLPALALRAPLGECRPFDTREAREDSPGRRRTDARCPLSAAGEAGRGRACRPCEPGGPRQVRARGGRGGRLSWL